MRSKLSKTIEDFTELLDVIDYLDNDTKKFILDLMADTFKTAYKLGVLDSAGEAARTAKKATAQVAKLVKVQGGVEAVTPETLSIFTTINVIASRIAKAILQLEKDELH